MVKIINDKYYEVEHFYKCSNKVKLTNPACYQNSRLVLTNTSNNFNKAILLHFDNINQSTTKTIPYFNKNFGLKSEYGLSKYNSMFNINKGTLNSLNFNTRNKEDYNNYKENEIKHYNSDTMTLYNKTNKLRITNLTNKNSFNLNPSNKKNELISTKNSNFVSSNYKTQALAYNYTKGSYFNHSINSLAEVRNNISTKNKFKIKDSNINNKNSVSIIKTKAKNKRIGNDINEIIRSIYDYSDESTENSYTFQKNKSLEKIIEEGSPRNNMILVEKKVKNEAGEEKISDKQLEKIKLSLMEKYLISTDYSMNLTYKMRLDNKFKLNNIRKLKQLQNESVVLSKCEKNSFIFNDVFNKKETADNIRSLPRISNSLNIVNLILIKCRDQAGYKLLSRCKYFLNEKLKCA